MNDWVKFIRECWLSSAVTRRQGPQHEYSALHVKGRENGRGRIKLPINEPAKAKRRKRRRVIAVLWR